MKRKRRMVKNLNRSNFRKKFRCMVARRLNTSRPSEICVSSSRYLRFRFYEKGKSSNLHHLKNSRHFRELPKKNDAYPNAQYLPSSIRGKFSPCSVPRTSITRAQKSGSQIVPLPEIRPLPVRLLQLGRGQLQPEEPDLGIQDDDVPDGFRPDVHPPHLDAL